MSNFDPSLPYWHMDNQRAAQERGLRYDARRQVYVDDEGYPVLDRFGQPL